MAELVVHQERITDVQALIALCPFGAIEAENDGILINAACKMCKLCVKKRTARGGGIR